MQLVQWEKVETFTDPDSHVVKFVFTKQDAVVETVLYKYPTYLERTVICHSVMSGCPMGCRFCGTGDFFIRNLTAEEMLEQVEYALYYVSLRDDSVYCRGINAIEKLQIMSMSMGEPMLNRQLDTVYRTLHDRYPRAALLMSTSAPDVDYEWFMQLAEDVPTVGMQFSVHESTDLARNKLIPFEKKLSLPGIVSKGSEFFTRTRRKPFFNYCAGASNSASEDADRLRQLFDPGIWEATVSVICEKDPSGLMKSSDRQRSMATDFSSLLVELGFNVRTFDPAGQDTIGGGCGQLWYVQQWAANNPTLVRPSCGHKERKDGQ